MPPAPTVPSAMTILAFARSTSGFYFGELLAGALRQLGVPAGVGEVPGEYCPGEFSVHDGGGRKLVGTAQRLVPGGWLFSSMIVVTDAAAVRDRRPDHRPLHHPARGPGRRPVYQGLRPGTAHPGRAVAGRS